ncbi:zinc finger protein 277 [Onthophagus taurus]|uniref:zinc finger protein 277 n=1 Tax=Onthophagus taurus TaxID=166361 RepID=UPI0039BEB26D
MSEMCTSKLLGPLSFDNSPESDEINKESPCLLCEDRFNLKLGFKIFLKHCFEVHNLVIEDVQNIDNLHDYLMYWKERFVLKPFESLVPSLKMEDTDEKYYLLSTLIKEDKELRHKLRLSYVLSIQERERTDVSFKRNCMFCKLELEGLRSDYLKHLSMKHNLTLGNPQNLVFVDELLDLIEKKLNEFICIYCEGRFPDRIILKEHMRKKMHKCVNPLNKNYDKFYIVNYLEINKSKRDEKDDNYALERDENSDNEYSDWNEKDYQIFCLFCAYKNPKIDELRLHMKNDHSFDFNEITGKLDFYQKVKLVNYIRRQMVHFNCVFCNQHFNHDHENKLHMNQEEHVKIPEINVFDQPEYFFPTYENDTLLYYLEDIES